MLTISGDLFNTILLGLSAGHTDDEAWQASYSLKRAFFTKVKEVVRTAPVGEEISPLRQEFIEMPYSAALFGVLKQLLVDVPTHEWSQKIYSSPEVLKLMVQNVITGAGSAEQIIVR